MEPILMQNLTWPELAALQEDHVVVLSIGAIEQHGPHLPLGTDYYISRRLAEMLGGMSDKLIIAPPFTYGFKSKPLSGGGPLFPGTIDLQGPTLMALVQDVLEEFFRDGFTRIFILNAHFENEAFLCEAMDQATRAFPKARVVMSNWWDVLDNDDIKVIFDGEPFPSWALEHAALTETSLMLYLYPELVRRELVRENMETARVRPYTVYPVRPDFVPGSGALAPSFNASAEKGRYITEKSLQAFLRIIKEEFFEE